jgi:glycosyltransferase involved in cell wall biosynthesis
MISIIIPMYNRATLVGETLDSVFAQTYADWECIVVDDGSTDNSVEVVQKYVDKDSRFKLLIRPEDRIKGAPTCRNIGFENSRGELIVFFDSDDILSPQFFDSVVREMNNVPNAEYGVIPCNKFIVSASKPVSHPHIYNPKYGTLNDQLIGLNIPVVTQNMIWRRSLLEQNDMLWREGLAKGQDPDFGIRTILTAHAGTWLEMEPMVHLRLHDNQMATAAAFRPEIGEVLISVFINLFYAAKDKGKMSNENHQLYFRGFFKYLLMTILSYGNSKASKRAYEFVRDNTKGIRYGRFYTQEAYILWLMTPILYYTGFPIIKFRNNRIMRWFKEKLWN